LQEKNEKLSVHSKTEPLVETLSNLHSQGAALISRKITDDSELSQLKVDMKEWSDTAAMWIAQNLSMAQGRLFERAALGKPIHKFLHEYNQEHRRVEHRAVEKTKYLQGLIDKYQG